MIEVRFELDEVDFDTLIDRYLPQIGEQLRNSGNPVGMLLSNGMSSELAKTILHGLGQEKQEQLCADLINGNHQRMTATLENQAQQQGVRLRVRNLRAQQHN
jgi:hypothetical protein